MLLLNNADFTRTINTLTQIGAQLAVCNERLSTGKRVNSAADDPSGIVALSNFNSQITRIDAAVSNGQRINSVIDTADGAMAQISSLIGAIQSKTLAAAGSTTTAEERAAYQAEIDAAIGAIDTLVNTTDFNGRKLLDGTISYDTSGVDNTELADVRVNSASVGTGSVSVDVDVVSAAEKAELGYVNGALVDDVTMSVTGNNGTEEFTFSTGTNIYQIESAINAQTDATGVAAEVVTGGVTTLYFRSEEYGSSQSVSVNVTEGTFVFVGGATSDTGTDATVTVNGQAAVTDGLQVYGSSTNLSIRFSLKESFGIVGGGSSSFTVSGEGAGFRFGAKATDEINYGVSSLNSNYLGNDSVGYLGSLKSGGANALSSGNYYAAYNVATTASNQIATERARIGAIQTYTVNTTLSSLSEAKGAMTKSISSIEDADYIAEAANKTRLQLLMQAGIAVLNTLQQNSTSVLSLLS